MVDKSLSGDPKGGLLKSTKRKKSCKSFDLQDSTAEREGFEPPVPCSTPVFKTGAFDHSAISPKMLYSGLNGCKDTECFWYGQAFWRFFLPRGRFSWILGENRGLWIGDKGIRRQATRGKGGAKQQGKGLSGTRNGIRNKGRNDRCRESDSTGGWRYACRSAKSMARRITGAMS